MASLGKISAAMNLFDEKKENLRKSFEVLQALPSSSLPSSFSTLQWVEIDSYFTSLYSSLQNKLNLLQTLKPSPVRKPSIPARPELKSLCENSDGLGLRRFINEQRYHRSAVKDELADAYRYAPDAAAMVLDAMDGFYADGPTGKGSESHVVRSTCVILLEELMLSKPEVTMELREKAMMLASGWKEKMTNSTAKDEKELEVLGFLLLVGAYGLMDGFGMEELIDYFAIIAKRRQSVELCRRIVPGDKISDLIQKLINKDMEIAAVKFSIEFDKTDQFPPVPLLKDYRIKSKKLAKKIRKNGKSLQAHNEANVKEISALKSIIKCIDDYHLEYPKDTLVALVEKLENEKGSKKRPATGPAPNNQQLSKAQKPKLNKGHKAATATGPTTVQPHLQKASLLPDHFVQYRSSPAASYGMAGHTPNVPYAGVTGSSTYGLAGANLANLGFTGNPGVPVSNFYHSELHPPVYHDRPLSYGGYEVPLQYHPSSYHPQ